MRFGVPDIETYRDFHSYYRNGWMGLKKEDHVSPIYILGVLNEDVVGVLRVLGPEHGHQQRQEHIQYRDILTTGSFGLPDVGMVDTSHSVEYVSLLASRDSHRGLRDGRQERTRFTTWEERLLGKEGANTRENERVFNLYNPKDRTLHQAAALLERGDYIGRRLNDKFGMYLNGGSVYPMLAYRNDACGYYADGVVMLYRKFLDIEPIVSARLGAKVVVT